MKQQTILKIDGVSYAKSSYSHDDRHCVGVAISQHGVSVINTKTHGPIVEFTRAEWSAFLSGVKDGEFEIEMLQQQGRSEP